MQLSKNGIPDVDCVLTTRELALMLKEAGIDFKSLEDQQADEPLGLYTGSALSLEHQAASWRLP